MVFLSAEDGGHATFYFVDGAGGEWIAADSDEELRKYRDRRSEDTETGLAASRHPGSEAGGCRVHYGRGPAVVVGLFSRRVAQRVRSLRGSTGGASQGSARA